MAARYTIEQAQERHFPILKAITKDGGAMSVALDRDVCVVGARRLVHLPLSAPCISKAQALIVRDSAGVYLRDLASRNQTFVNDQPVREARLGANDIVRFGPHAFQCESGFDPSAEVEPPAPAELWLHSGESDSRQIIPLEQYTFLIGSRYGCDLMLNGPDIALAHAVIFVRGGLRYLRDLSSHTGTLINSQACREVELNPGDEIRIGEARIEYHPAETSVTLEDDDSVDEDARDATHITEPPEELAVGEPSEDLIPIAFEESEVAPSHHEEIAGEVTLPWEDPEPIAFDLEPEESGVAAASR